MDPNHPTPAQRAADSDREAAADLIRAAAADGRLTVDELEERMTAVYGARTHPEIDALLADLRGRQELTARHQHQPAPRSPRASPGPRPSGRSRSWASPSVTASGVRRLRAGS